jgi:hypothetical protein
MRVPCAELREFHQLIVLHFRTPTATWVSPDPRS